MIELKNKSNPWCSSHTIHQSFDIIRYLLVISVTVIVLHFAWRIHWLLAIVGIFPVYILVLNLVGCLMLLLYALIAYVWSSFSPDRKVASEICISIGQLKVKSMWLFGNPKIEGTELKRCLAYYEAQFRVTAFQTKEADLFNNTLVKYLNSVKENPVAASEMCKAADRLVQAAHEVNRRHEDIQPIPDAASAMHLVWHVTFQSVTAWAEANLSSIEALANGMTSDKAYVQHLVDEYQAAWRKAQEEDKKFLRRVKVTAREMDRILNRTHEVTASDSWQPKPRDYDFGEVSKATQQA